MSEVIIGQKTEATAYFCPTCQSPVEVPAMLISNRQPVVCAGCGWDGFYDQLLQTTFKHEFKSDEAIAGQLVVEVRNLLAKHSAAIYGSFLLKWGFLDQPIQAAQLGRYIMEIAKATVTAIIQTRKTLAEEKARGRTERDG